ncbi:MAG: hypothetical protein ABIM89_12195 [Mycobacteriales bacterium]
MGQLIDSIGFDSIDVGGLAKSRIIQPAGALYTQVTAGQAARILAANEAGSR